MAQPQASQFRSSDATQCQVLIDAHLVRVAVLRDRLRSTIAPTQRTEARPKRCRSPGSNRHRGCEGPFSNPSSSTALSRPIESDERNRLILSIASARCWLEELVKGLVGDVAELAARENRTARSIRMTLSLAFLDPGLIDAACTGISSRLWRHAAHGSSGALCRSMARVGSDTPRLIRLPSFT